MKNEELEQICHEVTTKVCMQMGRPEFEELIHHQIMSALLQAQIIQIKEDGKIFSDVMNKAGGMVAHDSLR